MNDLLPQKAENYDTKVRYLLALAEGGHMGNAAAAIDVDRVTIYRWRKADPDFDKAIEEILEGPAADALEDEARRRAVDGTDEPIYFQGVLVGYVKRYSDGLLTKMLSARRRKLYGNEGTLRIGNVDGETLRTEVETTARIAALLEVAHRRQAEAEAIAAAVNAPEMPAAIAYRVGDELQGLA